MPNRRQFLQTSAALATPYVFSSSKSFADQVKSEGKFRLGLIGAGHMGVNHMRFAKDMCEVVALADVDEARQLRAQEKLKGYQVSDGKAALHNDYRPILDDKTIDVVYIATPDHWHAKAAIEAMRAGKDVYCEKPLTLTIEEGQLLRKVQLETKRVVQVGTMQRSYRDLFVKAIALVQQGRLGKLTRVQAAIGGAPACDPLPAVEPPAGLDWDRWLGPAPLVEYRSNGIGEVPRSNCHGNFRWWYQYSGGKLTDWGAHHVDIARWALDVNGQTDHPVSIGGTAKHPVPFDENGMPTEDDRFNTPTAFNFTAKLPSGTEIIIRNDTDNGVLLEGDKGRIFVNRGKLVGAPVDALKDDPLPEDAIQQAYRGMPMPYNRHQLHWANFFQCIRERTEPISDVASHMRALDLCHLAGVSARLGRELKLDWNSTDGKILGDEQAQSMLSREKRAGYKIDA
ncbi:MAG: Gfo/Idh/MocA family oxidoreductase [Lacipirellulaceae bacterium]